jgi:hypothetical protein
VIAASSSGPPVGTIVMRALGGVRRCPCRADVPCRARPQRPDSLLRNDADRLAPSIRAHRLSDDLRAACGESCVHPVFDNVGGPILNSMLPLMVRCGRVVCCGAAAQYDERDDDLIQPGPQRIPQHLINRRVQLGGFMRGCRHGCNSHVAGAWCPACRAGRRELRPSRRLPVTRAVAPRIFASQPLCRRQSSSAGGARFGSCVCSFRLHHLRQSRCYHPLKTLHSLSSKATQHRGRLKPPRCSNADNTRR